jgi:hypothetical protein
MIEDKSQEVTGSTRLQDGPGGKRYVRSDEVLAFFGQISQLLSDLVRFDQRSQALEDLQRLR